VIEVVRFASVSLNPFPLSCEFQCIYSIQPDFIYWDALETMRKLYLVTFVAFFQKGSMMVRS
jgi:hypothetical protein